MNFTSRWKKKDFEINNELYYAKLTSLGCFYPLSITFEYDRVWSELSVLKDQWKIYNESKPGYRREGLSLFSMDGSTDGDIDLNSLREQNQLQGTRYTELSFRTPTAHWRHLTGVSEPLASISHLLARSHLIRLQTGGFFPPHRDLGQSFRLISFFNCSDTSLLFVIDDQKKYFRPNQLYFADTRKTHSVVSFQDDAVMLVLNVVLNRAAIDFVTKNLQEI